MFPSKLRKAPSLYPQVPFYLFRALQLLSSAIVSAVMAYFMYHIKHDGFSIPWTFIFLMATSALTFVYLAVTLSFHIRQTLYPRLSLPLNACLSTFWSIAFALLTWTIQPTLAHQCSTVFWGSSDGIWICQLYKLLFSSVVLGLTSSVAALSLDIFTCQKERKRGVYVLPEDDQNGLNLKGGMSKKVTKIHTALDGWQEERQRLRAQVETEKAAFFEEEQDITYHSRYGIR